MRGFILVALLLGCGPHFAQFQTREICYSRAEVAAQALIDAECPQGLIYCSAAARILGGLQRDQEACP